MATQIGDISSSGGLVTFTEAAPGQTPLVTLTDNGDGTLSIAVADQPPEPSAAGSVSCQLGSLALGGDVASVDSDGTLWCAETWPDPGSPASSAQFTQKASGPGAWATRGQLAPRSVPVNGWVVAASTSLLRKAFDALNDACSVQDPVPLQVAVDGDARWLLVVRQGEVVWQPINGVAARWSIQVEAADPRWFADAVSDSTGLPSATGGLTIPFTVPFTIAASVASGQVTLTNPGNATGPVVARLDGPLIGPQVTHVASGLQLVFKTSLQLLAGEWLIVDMEAQTALANGQVSRNAYIESRGWSGFDPGDNTWAFAAQSGSGLLTITGTPSWQ